MRCRNHFNKNYKFSVIGLIIKENKVAYYMLPSVACILLIEAEPAAPNSCRSMYVISALMFFQLLVATPGTRTGN